MIAQLDPIGVDVDEVCANLLAEWVARYNRDWNDNLQLADVRDWDMTKAVKPECGKKIYEYLSDKDLYAHVKPQPGALEGVNKLRLLGFRVVFVTSATKGHAGQKLQWLQDNGFLPPGRMVDPDYIEANDKSILRLAMLIDDRPKNVESVSCPAIMFPAAHNESWFPNTPDDDDRIGVMDKNARTSATAWSWIPEIVAHRLATGSYSDTPRITATPMITRQAVAVVDTTSKPTNPKDAIGSSKLPLSLFPFTAVATGAVGMTNGLCKYGRDNFRAIGIRASIYVDALMRHTSAWFEGEECDPDDGVPHLAAALACLAIIVDARAAGKMVDDRKVAGGYHELVKELTPHVGRLKLLHAEKDPKHYSIADNAELAAAQ